MAWLDLDCIGGGSTDQIGGTEIIKLTIYLEAI